MNTNNLIDKEEDLLFKAKMKDYYQEQEDYNLPNFIYLGDGNE